MAGVRLSPFVPYEGELAEILERWLRDFVEVPNPALGGFAPCPFVRAARKAGGVRIIETDQTELAAWEAARGFGASRAVIVAQRPPISPEALVSLALDLSEAFEASDLIALAIHEEAEMAPVNTTLPGVSMIVIQRLSELTAARAAIRDSGYYEAWGPGGFADFGG